MSRYSSFLEFYLQMQFYLDDASVLFFCTHLRNEGIIGSDMSYVLYHHRLPCSEVVNLVQRNDLASSSLKDHFLVERVSRNRHNLSYHR